MYVEEQKAVEFLYIKPVLYDNIIWSLIDLLTIVIDIITYISDWPGNFCWVITIIHAREKQTVTFLLEASTVNVLQG